MRVKDIKIGETYNGVKVLEDLGRVNRSRIYKVVCPICGKIFNSRADHIGKTKSCQECSQAHRFIDISRQRFGRLVALERVGMTLAPNGTRQSMWRCQCDCGKETIVKYISLTSGNTRSCGCMEEENRHTNMQKSVEQRRRSVSSGFMGTLETHPIYKIWKSMLMRCNNPNVKGYRLYGGRGIKVCERWSGNLGFENFVNDMGERPSPEHTLDRIDCNGDYELNNCRWATREVQCNNKRNNSYITIGKEQITCSQLSKRYGFYRIYVTHLIHRGVDVNEVIRRAMRPKGERRGKRGELQKHINHNRVVSDEVMKLLETNRK